MTSRERVAASLEHRQPDRVPVDFGGHRSSGIMALAYKKLREYLGLPRKPVRVYDMIQQLAVIDEDVLDRFGVDTIEFGRGFSLDDSDWKEWELPDGSPALIPSYVNVEKRGGDWFLKTPSGVDGGVQRKGMIYFDQIYWPYKGGVPEDLSGLPRAIDDVIWSIPSPPNLGALTMDELVAGAKKLRESTDRYIIFLFGGNLVEFASYLCEMSEFYMLMAADPDTTHRLLDGLVEIHMANLEKYLPAVGPYVDMVLFGDDLGMQSGPQFSPAMYREFFLPRHSAMWKRAKELADVKVQLHSCGGIRPLLDDLYEAGLDAVNPVQVSAEGMEASGLKRDFGDRLTLWGGGCDTQSVLSTGNTEQVRRHVLNQCSALAPGGGFVFQQVHNIMANVPPQNIVAMFDAVQEFTDNS